MWAWAASVTIASIVLQLPIPFLLARGPAGVDGLVQGAIGAVILWIAIRMRARLIGRGTRLWLAALGLIPLWGTIVAVVLTAIIESVRARTASGPR